MAQREDFDGNIGEGFILPNEDFHQLRYMIVRPDSVILALIREDDGTTLPEIHIPRRLIPTMTHLFIRLVRRTINEIVQYSLTPGL